MITGIVITLNESENITDCIHSLQQVCDEIIIVDSNSTDNTREIAQSLGAKVIRQSYLGDGFQKNVGIEYANNNWILSIDADERLTEGLVKAIQKLDLTNTPVDAFAFRRKNYIGSRWIKQCGWYPDYCLRLFNHNKTRFSAVKQHAKVQAKNPQRLDAHIDHYSFNNIGELFAKSGRNFSGRAAKIMFEKGKKTHAFAPFLHGINAFFRKYIVQRGFLGGVDGLTVSLSSAINSYLKYAKLLEYQRDPTVLKKEDFKKVW